jgi:hypothetical protein
VAVNTTRTLATDGLRDLLESGADEARVNEIRTHASGPAGKLPLTEHILLKFSRGDFLCL